MHKQKSEGWGGIRVLTTSFGLLLAGTTPAKHRQRDRESINDLLCSSLVLFDQQLPRTEKWTPVPAAEESATEPACSPIHFLLLLLLLLLLSVAFSLQATHCARLLANPSDLLPLVPKPTPLSTLTRAMRRGASDLSALVRLTYAAASPGCWSELQVPTSSNPHLLLLGRCPLQQSTCQFLFCFFLFLPVSSTTFPAESQLLPTEKELSSSSVISKRSLSFCCTSSEEPQSCFLFPPLPVLCSKLTRPA